MSTHNPERTGTNRPDTWNDNDELTGPTGIPPEGERHEDYFPGSSESKWYQKRGVQAAGAVLGLIGAGAAVFGVTQSGENIDSQREASTGQSTEAAPGAFKLGSASDYQSNPLQIVEDFFEIDNTWSNTGYGPDVPDDPRRGELGDDVAFAAEINGESDAQFAEEMLVSDWQNNPNLVEYYATSVRVHADNTALAIKTEPVKDGGFDAADIEPYIRYQTPDMSTAEVISSTDSEIVVQVEWDSGDNRDKNTAEDKITNGFDPNNESGESTLTFVEEDGTMRLADKQDS